MAFIMVATPLRNLDGLSSETLLVFLGNMLVGLVFLLSSFGGFFLLKGRDWAYSICFKASFAWLLFIPIGTVFGLYYFWFNHKFVRSSAQ